MKTNFNSRESLTPIACIAKNKQRIKQYGDTVYLKNGDEFQIEIFNPTDTKVSARIELNGKSIGPGIIVRPGERIFLDRYVQEAKKFLFETYKVNGDNKQVQQAIESNGDLVVKFHKEKSELPWDMSTGSIWFSASGGNSSSRTIKTLNNNFTTSSTNLSNLNNKNTTYTRSSNPGIVTASCSYSSSIPTMDICDSAPEEKYRGIVDFDPDMEQSQSRNMSKSRMKLSKETLSAPKTNEIETGRVEKGSYSDQKFKPDYTSFEVSPTWRSEWKILPESRKEVVSEDLVQYCADCGRKRRKNEKFCPSCGNKF